MSPKRLYNHINFKFKLVLKSQHIIIIVKTNVRIKVISAAVSCNLSLSRPGCFCLFVFWGLGWGDYPPLYNLSSIAAKTVSLGGQILRPKMSPLRSAT